MNTISLDQNHEEMVHLLVAQRQAYSKTKGFMNFQVLFLLGLPIVSTLSLLLARAFGLSSLEVSLFFGGVSVAYLFVDLFYLNNKIEYFRGLGALIQEKFDTQLLKIEWNSILCSKQPSKSIVDSFYKEYIDQGKKLEPLFDWYGKVDPTKDYFTASLECQIINLWYDQKLKFRFNIVILAALVSAVFIVGCSLVYLGLNLAIFVSYFIQFIQFLKYVLMHYSGNAKSISSTQLAHSFASGMLENSLAGFACDDNLKNKFKREIQDSIFNNRKNTLEIPDWFYWINRKFLEKRLPQ